MKKNIILCWAHVGLFSVTFFVVSTVWPKWMHRLSAEGKELHDVDLYNQIYPIFSWLQNNLIVVLLFMAAFTLDLLICLRLKSKKQKVIWTVVLLTAFIIGAVVASSVYRTALLG